MASANIKFDEYIKKNEIECKKIPKDYNSFIYVNDSGQITLPK